MLSFGLLSDLGTRPRLRSNGYHERTKPNIAVSWPKCLHRFNSVSRTKQWLQDLAECSNHLINPHISSGFHYRNPRYEKRRALTPLLSRAFRRRGLIAPPRKPAPRSAPAPGLARACGAQSPLARSRVRGASPLASWRAGREPQGWLARAGSGLPGGPGVTAGRHTGPRL